MDGLAKRISSWVETATGVFARRVVEQSAKAETWKYEDGSTLAISGAATTSDVSSFMPFDTLTFTEVGAVATATWSLQLRPGSKGSVVTSGTGTITITGDVNGVASGALLVTKASDGLSIPATALSAGTYYLEN